MRESLEQKKRRGSEILHRLRDDIPEPTTALVYESPFQLLVATILSAQCTDARVNIVTPELFRQAPTPEAMVKLGEKKIRTLIKSINFFNTKAKNIWLSAKLLVKEYDSKLPQSLDELVKFPGVGRKTANVVLGTAFEVPGVVVDTHVIRVGNRLGLTNRQDPVKIEKDLEKLFAPEDWVDLSHLLVLHGRKTCNARKPRCAICCVRNFCPSFSIFFDVKSLFTKV